MGVDWSDYPDLATMIREVILSPEDIQNRIAELGAAITRDYQGRSPVFVGVLKGVLFFMADLLRQVPLPLEVDFLAISNYSAESRDQGLVRLMKDLDIPLTGRHVIFVEDVIDTGLTLNYLLRILRSQHPASLEVCVLFNKARRRLIEIPIKYKGFDLPDKFVVGYGLDHREKYRNLPFVGLLRPEAILDNSKESPEG
jgi:hypoxanthine phosphoribosyltransferase